MQNNIPVPLNLYHVMAFIVNYHDRQIINAKSKGENYLLTWPYIKLSNYQTCYFHFA